jgi:hypothetical protein
MTKKCLIAFILLLGCIFSVYSEGSAEVIGPLIQLGAYVIDEAVSSSNNSSSSSSSGITYYYSITTGKFTSSDGSVSAYGYSGGGSVSKGDIFDSTHKNNPDSTSLKNFGPIPAGTWTITGVDSSITINTILLSPTFSTNRTDIAIHGDSNDNRGKASRGCIILGPDERASIVAAYNRYSRLNLIVSR